MKYLPPPTIPFQGWHQMIGALWSFGLKNVDEANLHSRLEHAYGEMIRKREDSKPWLLRPSSNIDCTMKHWLILQGHRPDESDKTHMLPTFNVGHLLHAHAFAQIESVLPEGFIVEFEKKVDLWDLEWWPRDEAVARRYGSADMVIAWTDEEAALRYFEELPSQICLGDFKSAADHTHKQAAQGRPEAKADPFGNFSQLSVYQGALGLTGEAVLAFTNRNILSGKAPLASRPLSPQFLAAELDNVKERVTNPECVPEKLRRWGKSIAWYCNPEETWCALAAACSEFRHPESVDV